MQMIKKIIDFINKKLKGDYCSGICIKPSGDFQFIEIKKNKKSYLPTIWKEDFVGNIDDVKLFKKKDFINKIKKLRNISNSKTVFLNSLKNKEIEKEIISAIKISGFEKVIVKEKNIEGIILNKKLINKNLTVLFQEGEAVFYISDGKKINKKEKIKIKDISVARIEEILKKIKNKEVSLINVDEEIINSIKNIFYILGFKARNKNIWENFLDFSDTIPGIFMNDSHKFIDVLSITVPNLKNWKRKKKEVKNIKEKSLYLPKKKKKVFLSNPKKEIVKKEKKKSTTNKKITEMPEVKLKNTKIGFWNRLKNNFSTKERGKQEPAIKKNKICKTKPQKKIKNKVKKKNINSIQDLRLKK